MKIKNKISVNKTVFLNIETVYYNIVTLKKQCYDYNSPLKLNTILVIFRVKIHYIFYLLKMLIKINNMRL